MRIIIATLGRVHDQKTYHSLPDKYKDKVTFIVQPHEFEEMKSIYSAIDEFFVNLD